MLAQTDILRFSTLFTGAKEFYGVTLVKDIVNGKAQSTSTCIHEIPSVSVYAKHLAGEQSIGISPLKADNTLSFGAIDIDDYQGDIMKVVRAIWDFDMPICPCFSKSKKLHLYFFFTEETLATDAIEIMRWYARALGCSKKVEVFPKQAMRTAGNKAYSWINLPYFNCDDPENHRKMVQRDGSYASIDDFLDRASDVTLSFNDHTDRIHALPYYDAPPCIVTGALLRDVGAGGRNNWLYSCATYLRMKDENCDLEDALGQLNASLDDPLPDSELRSTVIASVKRKTCFYLCSQMSHCDKSECIKLEHGVGSAKSTGLEYGQLTQYMSDPPTYVWQVNGQDMRFYSEQELLQQTKFRCLCLRQLHLVPRKVDDAIWSKIVTRAASNIKVEYQDTKGGDFSSGSIFYDLTCMYFSDKRKAANMSQIAMGRVFEDKENKEFVFTSNSFLRFMRDTNNFKDLSQMEMKTKLEEMGAYKRGNTWRIPTDAIEDTGKNNVQLDLDLHEGESNDF